MIGGGIFVGSMIGESEEKMSAGEKKVEAPKLKPRPKPRKKEKTTERPDREARWWSFLKKIVVISLII